MKVLVPLVCIALFASFTAAKFVEDDGKTLSSSDDDNKILAPLEDEDKIQSPLDDDDDGYDDDDDEGDDDDNDDDEGDDDNENDNYEILSPLDDDQYFSTSEDESTDPILRLIRRARRPKPKTSRCPTIRFPCARMPNVCMNIRNAFRLGKPRQLQRITNRSQIRRNRRQSGCRKLGRKAGYNCDEYPFASSRQGGAGAVVKLVPIRENSIQGGMLAAFYARNNIGNGGCFRVRV